LWRDGAAGHVEETLVLLVSLVQHGGQLRDMLTVGLLPRLVQTSMFPFPFLHQTQLFTEDVYEGVYRRLWTFNTLGL
jgi:hypothetical protein